MMVYVLIKGGVIEWVVLKEYFKVFFDSVGNEIKVLLELLEDKKNKFEYFLLVVGVFNGIVCISELFFILSFDGNILCMWVNVGLG